MAKKRYSWEYDIKPMTGGYDRQSASSDTVFDTENYSKDEIQNRNSVSNNDIFKNAPTTSNSWGDFQRNFNAKPTIWDKMSNANENSTPTASKGFWGTLQDYDKKFNNSVDNFMQSNPITRFINRASYAAANTLTNGGAVGDNTDVGNGIANTAADFIGTGLGFVTRLPGTDFSIGTAMNKTIGQPVENALSKVASKYGVNNYMSNLAKNTDSKVAKYALNNIVDYGVKGLKTGAEFGGYEGLSNAIQGKNVGEGVKEGFVQGVLWGAGGKALGDFTHSLSGRKVKVLNDDGKNVKLKDENGNIHDMEKSLFDNTSQKIPQQTIEKINNSEFLSPYTPQELIAAKNYNNGVKNSMDNLGFNSDVVNNNAINNEIKNRLGKEGGTKYTVKNTAQNQAEQEFQNAMDKIHNHFGTNKLTPKEQARIKPELGIDLEKLLSNIETSKTDIRNIGERQRLKQVAGVNSTAFNPVTETITEKLPFVRTLKQPIITEQIPSVMTYREKVPTTASEQIPVVRVKKDRNVDYVRQETGLPQFETTTNYIDGTEQVPLVRMKKERNLQEQPIQNEANSQIAADTTNNKNIDLNSMAKEDLFNSIDKANPHQTYKPTENVVDWGTGKARGQGKRVGNMVMGGMGDAPQGKKTYVNLVGNVPEFKSNPEDFKGMENIDKINYLKAREYGLNHNQARVYQVVKHDSHGLSDQQIMDRFKHYEDAKPIETIDNSNKKQPIPMDEETYLANNGASKFGFGDSGLHKTSNQVIGNKQSEMAKQQFIKDGELAKKREVLRQEYQQKVASGEIRPLTNVERLIETANGHADNKSVQSARKSLEKRGIDWKQEETSQNTSHKVYDLVDLGNNEAGAITKVNNDGTYEVQRENGEYALVKKNRNTFETVKSQPTPKEQISIDDRNSTNVGSREIKSYQYLHPELKSYIQDDAETLLHDLKNTSKGERGTREDGSTWGSQRLTSPDIAYLRDSYKMSYKDIERGLKKLIEDDGAENNAASKKIETVIDKRLSNGYQDMDMNNISPNKEYATKKNEIEDKGEKLNVYNNTLDYSGYKEKPTTKKVVDVKETGNPQYKVIEKITHDTTPDYSGYKENPYETTQNQSTSVWTGYETKEINKPLDNKESGYKTIVHEKKYAVPQDAKYPKNEKVPVLTNPKKPITEGESYNLKNLGDVTVKSVDGNNIVLNKNGKDIPITRKAFNNLNRSEVINRDTKIEQKQAQSKVKIEFNPNVPTEVKPSKNPSKIDYSTINDVDVLNKHITDLKEARKTTTDKSKLQAMDLQLFSAEQQLKKLKEIVRPDIDKTKSKIVMEEEKGKFNFKNALNKFYTRVVDINKPISDMSKVSGDKSYVKATNSKNVGGIVDHILQNALVDRQGNKIGHSLKQIMNQIPKGKEEQFWEYMLHKHNVQRAEVGKNVFKDYDSSASDTAAKEFENLNPGLKRAGQELNKFLNKFMDEWGHKSGLISTDLWTALKKEYPNYIPTNRVFSELEGSFEKTNGKGFVDQTNPLSKATGSDRDIKNPLINIMNLVNRTVRTSKYNEVGQEILSSIKKSPEELQKFAEIITEKDANGNKIELNLNHDNIVTVLDNGEKVHMKINNKPLLDALHSINKSDVGDINRNVKKATNLFKALITTKNPLFALSNVSRDIPTYLINSKENNPIKATKNLVGAFKDISTNSDTYKQYKGVGGGGSNFFNVENPYKSVKDLTGSRNILRKLDEGIEKFNNVLETGPRLAEFKNTLKKTGDIQQALFDANDVTTNFSRGGDITKNVDAWVPYLNAGVQGLDKLARQFKNKPFSTAAKGFAGVTSLSILQGIANTNNPNYDKLDNRTKDNYYLIPQGDTFIKIPKSREYGVIFGSLFERIARKVQGDPQSFKGFGSTVATNFAPTNPLESNILSPYLNLRANKDFADRPIVPQTMEGRSPYLQYDEKTSEIGKKLGELTGMSPKQVDYVIKSYTGVIGQFVLPMTTIANIRGGSKAGDLLSPVTSRYTADPLYNNQDIQDFYNNMSKASTSAKDKNFVEKLDPKARTHEEFISSAFAKANKTIGDLTKQSFEALQEGDMTKVRDLRKQIIDIASETNKYMASDGEISDTSTPGELKNKITEQIKYQKGDNYTKIRKEAEQIYKSTSLSNEEKTKKLQELYDNKASNKKQGTPPKKKAEPANPYDK